MVSMTRCFAPGGVLVAEAAEYYAERARNGIGLIIYRRRMDSSPRPSIDENARCFFGEDALSAWAIVLKAVHEAGGKIVPQLWHAGQTVRPRLEGLNAEGSSYSQITMRHVKLDTVETARRTIVRGSRIPVDEFTNLPSRHRCGRHTDDRSDRD